ncbi:MAG TPA: YihY/virulence factor BrkB family protein [Candidatus Limnocylindria bacterium]|nr:YihY/virulence factor BrkB family protein [Candidatus Limnocylindria bacterium]
MLDQPAVAAGRRIIDRYAAAEGGLLAGGLAYAALFAIVPAVLLLAGVGGLVYADPAERAEVVAVLVGVLPPMRDLIETVLTEVARDAAPVSILGGIALIWGTSRFVVGFQGAIARVMGGEQRRGLLVSNLAAIGAVVLMVAVIPVSAVLSAMVAFLEIGEQLGIIQVASTALSLALGVLPVVATLFAMVLVYRIVPSPTPSWRAAIPPGITVGLALTVVARLFAFLAPKLIGAAALIGTLATVFAALAWLALSFQAILIGAAWVRDRGERMTPPGARALEP